MEKQFNVYIYFFLLQFFFLYVIAQSTFRILSFQFNKTETSNAFFLCSFITLKPLILFTLAKKTFLFDSVYQM